MLWDLILEIPVTKKKIPSHWIKLSFLPTPFPNWYKSFLVLYSIYPDVQAFPIKSWQKVLKSPRLKGGAMKISSGAGNFMVELKSYKGGAAPF